MRNLFKGFCGLGGDLQKFKQRWPEIWFGTSQAAKKNETQEWAMEKTKLDNARKLRGLNLIDREDREKTHH